MRARHGENVTSFDRKRLLMDCIREKCPHKALMERARAACLSCARAESSGRGGTISLDAAGERLIERERLHFLKEPRGQMTALPPDVEDLTAELYRRWCGLDTIDALLVLHVSNGGTCASFGAYLCRVADAIAAADVRRPAFRATAWAKFRRVVRRFAPFLKGRLHSWTDGHGGAIRREREREDAQPSLFDLPLAGVGTPEGGGAGQLPRGEVKGGNRVTFSWRKSGVCG